MHVTLEISIYKITILENLLNCQEYPNNNLSVFLCDNDKNNIN